MKTSKSNVFRVCSLLTLGLTTGMIFADEDDRGNKKRGSQDHHSREKSAHFKSFRVVDANKDGALTFEEFSMMGRLTKMNEEKRRKLFDFLDRNKDGKLHQRELQSREPNWIRSLRNNFAKIDRDDSGSLDLGEIAQDPTLSGKSKKMLTRLFVEMDRNKNQVIERSELKWSAGPRGKPQIYFAKYDLNQSGGLDFEEYSKLPFMDKCSEARRKHLFERIDTNKDGQISAKEVKVAHKVHRPFAPHSKPHRGPRRDGGGDEEKPPRSRQKEPQKGDIKPAIIPKTINL